MAAQRICCVDGCGKPHDSNGYCGMHAQRMRRYGDINATKMPSKGKIHDWCKDVAAAHNGDGCLRWPFGYYASGYGQVAVEGKKMNASRYVCILVHGDPPDTKSEAAHSCGKGHEGCVSGAHLRWASHVENEKDKLSHGTDQFGERNPTAKLKQDDVGKILELVRQGVRQVDIATRFNVSQSNISMIVCGKTWQPPAG